MSPDCSSLGRQSLPTTPALSISECIADHITQQMTNNYVRLQMNYAADVYK